MASDPLFSLLEQSAWSKKSILDLYGPIFEKKKLKFIEIFLSFRILKFQKYFLDHLDSISEKKKWDRGKKEEKEDKEEKKGRV